MPNELLTGEK